MTPPMYMQFVALAAMVGAVWWYRPKRWRVPLYEETFPLHLKEVEETPENIALGVVVEDTPEGRVKMRRSGETFEYWAQRAMAYKYLEPVARKHVLVHGGAYAKMARATMVDARVNAVGGVFAALKTYGKNREMRKEINKYKWMGKEEEQLTARATARSISFADFKNKKD